MINALKAEGLDIVTELSPVPTFYEAEDYHQNFLPKTLPKATVTL